jgi:hypothetical protein
MIKKIRMLAPPGYGTVVPLDKQAHAGLGLPAESNYQWCSALNAVFLNASEFGRASLDFPIAFTRDEQSGEFMPIAVLGMKAKQNLFVSSEGQWRPQSYIPAYFRRFPFCIAEVPMPNGEAAQRMICVQENCLRPSKTPLFDVHGNPTTIWPPILKLLEAIEATRQQTRVLVRRLEALELLVPFDAIAVPRQGEQLRLQGMFRVDEEKLQAIPGKDLRTMMKRGELRAVYAHLISLENFGRLLDLNQMKTVH